MSPNSLWDRIFHSWSTCKDDIVGSSAQPVALLDKLNVLSMFYVQGGKFVAGLLGTGIVEELGRDNPYISNVLKQPLIIF